MNLTGLFSYFQHGEVFFSLEVVFNTQEFLLFTQELIHFTQEVLRSLPKKLRTPYSRNLRVLTDDQIYSPLLVNKISG